MNTSLTTVSPQSQMVRFAGKQASAEADQNVTLRMKNYLNQAISAQKAAKSAPADTLRFSGNSKTKEQPEAKDGEANGNSTDQENFFLFNWFKRIGRIIGIKMEKGISKLEEGHEEELLDEQYKGVLEKLANQRVVINKFGAAFLKAKDQYEKMEAEYKQQQDEAMVAFRAMKKAEEKGDTSAMENLKKMAIAQQKKAQSLEPRVALMRERVTTAETQKKAADAKWERLQEQKEMLKHQVEELKDKARMARLMKQERELDEELKALSGEDLALNSQFADLATKINDRLYYEKAAGQENLRTAEEMLAQQAIQEYQEGAANENALAELEKKFAVEVPTATEKKAEVKTKTAGANGNGANSVADATE